MAAFYEHDGASYLATELTRGPWDPGAQHAGPPAALLGRELELLPEAEDFQVSRITFEILRSIPIGPVEVEARIVRPGRRVQMLEAELRVDGEVADDRAGLAAAEAGARPARGGDRDPAGPGDPERAGPVDLPAERHQRRLPDGDGAALHLRRLHRARPGASPGCGSAGPWSATRSPTPLQRVLVAADVGNGISAAIDFRKFLFVNVDLTVQLERLPDGEWVGVDAVTLAQPTGRATAESALLDERGRFGRALQSLLVSPR